MVLVVTMVNIAVPVSSLFPAFFVPEQVVFFEEKIAMMYDVNPKLRIMGSGFDTLDASNVKFKFAPKISAEDYSIDITSSRVITLNFKEGKKWVQY